MEDGKVLSFGTNGKGELGRGDDLWQQSPQKLVNLRVKDVATSKTATFFLDLNGSLWSVGADEWGVLGNGTKKLSTSVPEKVVEGNVSSVEAGNATVLYRDENGSLMGLELVDMADWETILLTIEFHPFWYTMEM